MAIQREEFKIDIDQILSSKLGTKSKFVPKFVATWLKKIIHQDWMNIYLCGEGMGKSGAEWIDGCLNYIANRKVSKKTMTIFRIAACTLVFFGALMDFSMVWNLADVLMGTMAIINLPVIVILGKVALDALKDYSEQRKAGKDPKFKAASIGLKSKTDFWN